MSNIKHWITECTELPSHLSPPLISPPGSVVTTTLTCPRSTPALVSSPPCTQSFNRAIYLNTTFSVTLLNISASSSRTSIYLDLVISIIWNRECIKIDPGPLLADHCLDSVIYGLWQNSASQSEGSLLESMGQAYPGRICHWGRAVPPPVNHRCLSVDQRKTFTRSRWRPRSSSTILQGASGSFFPNLVAPERPALQVPDTGLSAASSLYLISKSKSLEWSLDKYFKQAWGRQATLC